MAKLEYLKTHLSQTIELDSPSKRRKILIDEMRKLSADKIDCMNCTGTCCTSVANSMQITPIEALEIIESLLDSNVNLNEVIHTLEQNIKAYRLDHEIFLSKKINPLMRKTYTCPFFIPGPKGCSIKKELKPYGCLGFNPRNKDDNGSRCLSNSNLLEERETNELKKEDLANLYLTNELKLTWSKQEIPKAVLSVLEKLLPFQNS